MIPLDRHRFDGQELALPRLQVPRRRVEALDDLLVQERA